MQLLIHSFLGCLLFVSSASYALVIGFDELPETAPGATPGLPSNYQGFDWKYFGYLTGASWPGSGYESGTVSPKNVAYSGFNLNPEIIALNDETFDFNGAYITAAWIEDLQLDVTGFLDNIIIYQATIFPLKSKPTWYAFNYFGVDRVLFTRIGSGATNFAMDNVALNETPIPLPASLALLIVGFLGLSYSKRAQRI